MRNSLTAFRYHMPTEIVYGPGCLEDLGERCAASGARPLLITGRRSARQSGALDRALSQLPDATVFDDVEENPSTATCDRAAERCREHDCGVIVAIGGGSPMDVAKAAAGLALNDGPCAQYFGRETFPRGALPVIAVPTTAGTGSEVTPYAVIVDRQDDGKQAAKRTIGGRDLFPALALLDPNLSVTMPPSVTANTGLDALSQAMEGMASKKSTPLGDALALEACRIVKRWLPVAIENGSDLEARGHMLYAAMLSGCIIAQSGTTLVHGMGYYFTLECGVPHGLANALLLAPLFQFNADHLPGTVAAMAGALGFPCDPEPRHTRKAIGEALHALLEECGVSPAARDAGVDRGLLESFAQDVAGDPYRFRNQVGEISQSAILRFYQAAYEGALL